MVSSGESSDECVPLTVWSGDDSDEYDPDDVKTRPSAARATHRPPINEGMSGELSCHACTFINKITAVRCAMCGLKIHQNPRDSKKLKDLCTLGKGVPGQPLPFLRSRPGGGNAALESVRINVPRGHNLPVVCAPGTLLFICETLMRASTSAADVGYADVRREAASAQKDY